MNRSALASAACAALTSAREARRPTLLVFDDVDRAGEEQLARLGELVAELAGLPVLVLATTEDPALPTRLGTDATLELPSSQSAEPAASETGCAPWRSSMLGDAMT